MPERDPFGEIAAIVQERREQDWRERAACRGTPGLGWFTAEGERYDEAKLTEICSSCSVRSDCAEYAESIGVRLHGFWACTTDRQRARMRRQRRRLAG